jgi:hypothetical protein
MPERSYLQNSLQEGEEPIIADRRHFVMVASRIAISLAALAVMIVVVALRASQLIQIVSVVLFLLYFCRLLIAIIKWQIDLFVVTTMRVLVVKPFGNDDEIAKLRSIVEIKLRYSWHGRLLGYADLVIVAGAGRRSIECICFPKQTYSQIVKLQGSLFD